MDGEGSMNIGSALNTIQQLMSLVFLYLFFDKPNGKTKRLLPFLSAALLLLAVTMVGTVNALTSNYLYYLITAVITIIYTTIFLRGKLYLRIIIPIAVSNISIAYLTVSVMSASGALPFLLCGSELMTVSLIGVTFFSMTMAVTLALIVSVMKKYPGVAFGFTTVGLFLGTVPVFFVRIRSMLVNCIIISVLTVVCVIILTMICAKKKSDKRID